MLTRILEHADQRAERAESSLARFRDEVRSVPPARDFRSALTGPGLAVIAEIKRRSPSAGDIDLAVDPAEQATRYVAGGASAISVLTEPEFFAGSLDDLKAVRAAVDVPVLRKDFTRNEAQVWEARAAGADAVLLIVAALDSDRLTGLLRAAEDAGLAAIVEAHTEDEVATAIAASATIIGVNNRDLTTFETHLEVAERAASLLPSGVVRIAESGVSDPAGAARMAAAGYDAILVGEALVRSNDPAGLVSDLRSAR